MTIQSEPVRSYIERMRTFPVLLAIAACIGCGGPAPAGTDGGGADAARADGGGATCTPACAPTERCVAGTCQPTGGTCGDGHVDPGEECDDGNPNAFDGCEPASSPTPCHFSCRVDEDCRDGLECNGNETCALHVCSPGTPL